MSYAHLAGRLIETQRSMLGESAIKVARSVEGITVTDDGSVETVSGDRRAVVGELAEQYTTLLGNAAEQRLMAAAGEFEDELILPAALGGPETVRAEMAADGPTVGEQAGNAVAPDTVSDGGTVAAEAGPSTTEPASGGETSAESQSNDDSEGGATGSRPDGDRLVTDPIKVEYTVASSAAVEQGAPLGEIYLLPAHDRGWQVPVTVADAFVDAVVEATGLDGDAFGGIGEYVDAERLRATLNDERGKTVSFEVEEFTVTFHRSGSLAVH
jgi:hypothetical protein